MATRRHAHLNDRRIHVAELETDTGHVFTVVDIHGLTRKEFDAIPAPEHTFSTFWTKDFGLGISFYCDEPPAPDPVAVALQECYSI